MEQVLHRILKTIYNLLTCCNVCDKFAFNMLSVMCKFSKLSFPDFVTSIGRVVIINLSHPMYVKSGADLALTCVNPTRTSIQWIQQTAENDWKDTAISFTADDLGSGLKYTMHSCIEEPSGPTRNTLIKHNMTLHDRGLYVCKGLDDSSSYITYVTVLYGKIIIRCNVTVSKLSNLLINTLQ